MKARPHYQQKKNTLKSFNSGSHHLNECKNAPIEGTVCVLPKSVPYARRAGMPYSARTCGGGGPGGGPGGFFPGGKRGTPGTVANIGPEDDVRDPLLKHT